MAKKRGWSLKGKPSLSFKFASFLEYTTELLLTSALTRQTYDVVSAAMQPKNLSFKCSEEQLLQSCRDGEQMFCHVTLLSRKP